MQETQKTTIQEFESEGNGRYGKYPNYKEIDGSLLSVPDHWEVRRLKFCAKINPSKNEVEDLDPETEVTFLPMEDVSEQGEINHGETELLEDVIDGYTYFREGDVLVAKITPCFENGKGALAKNIKNNIGFGTTEFVVLRPDDELNNEFLYYVTASNLFRKVGEGQMKGAAGQKRVPDEFFQNFPQPLPPKEEQLAIVNFLNKEENRINKLIREKKRLIDLLREKEVSLIKNLVSNGIKSNRNVKQSGVEWLGDIPEDWEVRDLRYIADIDTGDKDTKDAIDDGDYPFFVRSQTEERINSYTYDGEAVLTAGDGVGVGEVFHYVNGKFDYHQRVYKISDFPDEIDGKYLYYYLRANLKMEIFKNNAKSTVDSLRMPMFKSFPVAFGSLEEQHDIVNLLDKQSKETDDLVNKVREGIDRLKEYRTALITNTVTGQIDVRGEV
ncbi:restriction endonuclease subunit S [Halomicroarcula sp. F13]|uniref:Restriction endonuclease subunit S n=1 Tax=Haloarcula rubra TaxID=2487747 RepID=A0AAW4PWY8_9EURY|nr:restriction endonuclease subunit S [Halomicroarcula rubra]MBX0324792.1 restriction endonuclease subunit S [Halomicroarcula rubra]